MTFNKIALFGSLFGLLGLPGKNVGVGGFSRPLPASRPKQERRKPAVVRARPASDPLAAERAAHNAQVDAARADKKAKQAARKAARKAGRP